MPLLVAYGEQDRQIGLEYARQAYDQLTNCLNRELKIFTPREGGVEQVGADTMSYGRDYIADWFADTLGGLRTPIPAHLVVDAETRENPRLSGSFTRLC